MVANVVRFNCTFMELKFTHHVAIDTEIRVLIVPLWN